MKHAVMIALLVVTSCGQPTIHEKAFHAKQEKLIKSKAQILRDAHRLDDDYMGDFTLLGSYGWFSGICDEDSKPSACSFGSYVFSEAAFEQAKLVWRGHMQMAENSDLLISVDGTEFDKSVVGYSVGYLTYCSLHGGKLWHCDEKGFNGAKVVEFIDKHTLRLDKKATWDAEMNHVLITPPTFVDMCNCTL